MTLTRPRITTFHITFVSKIICWVAVCVGARSFMAWRGIFDTITLTACWPLALDKAEYHSGDYPVRRGIVVAQEEGRI
jgi:hypothetical protein